MLRFVVALLLAVACSADIGKYSEEIFNECTVCNLQNALIKNPEFQAIFPHIPVTVPMDCQDVCAHQEKSCHALKLAMSEVAADSVEIEYLKEFSELLAMLVDPYTMCGAVPRSKYGQKMFLGLDEKLGCKVCGMGTKFICNTFFKGDTATKIANAIGSGAKKLCIAIKIPNLFERFKTIFGDFDPCGKIEELAKGLPEKIIAPLFCNNEKASGFCGKLFDGCKVE